MQVNFKGLGSLQFIPHKSGTLEKKFAKRKFIKSPTLRLVYGYPQSSILVCLNIVGKFLCFRKKATSQALIKKMFLGTGR